MKRLIFVDRSGVGRVLTACPPIQLEEFVWSAQRAIEAIAQRDPEACYVNDLTVAHLCDRALEAAGVNPDWCSPVDVVHLLFDEDGLLELNRPKKATDGKQLTIEEYVASIVAALISTEGSIDRALHLASTVPRDRLEAILDARIEQLKQSTLEQSDPEQSASLTEIAQQLGDNDVFGSINLDSLAKSAHNPAFAPIRNN